MPNIRVRQAIEKLQKEINRVGEHIVQYSGIDKKDAFAIDNAATDIATTAAQIAELARQAQGVRDTSTVRKVRRALGFTHP
jgi:hypothetical protein